MAAETLGDLPNAEVDERVWQKSSYSIATSASVEVQAVQGRVDGATGEVQPGVLVRDSLGIVLAFKRDAYLEFKNRIASGELDDIAA